LVILFAERVRGAVLVPLLLGALLLEEVAFSLKLLVLECEFGDFFLQQGALRTGSSGHGNSSAHGKGRALAEADQGRCVKVCSGVGTQ
jgi:hypothetical protein